MEYIAKSILIFCIILMLRNAYVTAFELSMIDELEKLGYGREMLNEMDKLSWIKARFLFWKSMKSLYKHTKLYNIMN